ncbi:RHS repeat-associated core domain-containing protein [Xenorhabdus ehlersii]|uniref:RHS repeat-associated protein n=2 Tax=Xenorhabdus ehlersii TaxID=290111 RepID=A0A2D0IJY9_9GAMM|nr:RHS repeat-associated core domain-containing protein [Xenorhabdus ehlersii]PHM22095.1 rhsA protein in rhs element [Xenorhabdus ehlersii]RKE91862.1 RHS repeat-associated protein [Xenorhabdus ehlersii]
MGETISITGGRDEKVFCEAYNIRTLAEAEAIQKHIPALIQQETMGNHWLTAEDIEQITEAEGRLAVKVIDKFKSGEFPLEEWKHTPPEPNESLPTKARDDSPSGTGNTIGKIVGQASQGTDPPQEANAAVTPETEQEKGFLDKAGEWWDETKEGVTKWGKEAGEKLGAAWDNPGKAAIGAAKGVWNTVPDVGEFLFRTTAGMPAAMMSASGTVLKYAGADALGDTALAAADTWNKQVVDKAVELSHVDAIRFDITDKAEQGGALISDGVSLATGVGGLVRGAAKQGAKATAKATKPAPGAKVKEKPQDAPDAKPQKVPPKDDATPSNKKDGNDNGLSTKEGDPVDMATGDFLQVWPVLAIPGLLPINLSRTYRSTADLHGLFGPKWADDWSLQLAIGQEEVHYTHTDGVVYDFATPDNRVLSRNRHLPHCLLTGELTGELCLTDRLAQLMYHFSPISGSTRKLSAITDRRQNRIDFIYDKHAQLIEVTRNDGLRLSLQYLDGQLHTLDMHEIRDGQLVGQRLLTCQYDPQGYLNECDAFQHNHLWHEYDQQGRMTRWHDTDQTDLMISYDERGRVLSTTSPSGYWHDRFRYDDNARITTYLDGEGGETRYHYDPNGLVIREVDPLGRITRRQWRHSLLMWESNPSGQMTTFDYNADGALTEVVLPTGETFVYAYDEHGQLTESHLPTGERWQWHYDEQGNLTALTNPLGHREEYQYGLHGELRQRLLPDGQTWHYAYDEHQRLAAVMMPNGETTGLELDELGRLRQLTDALKQQTRYRYSDDHASLNGSLTEVELPDGTTQQLAYDSERRVVAVTDGEGRTTRYTYGAFDLLTQVTRPDGTTLRFGYDRLTRLNSVTAATGETYRYERDAAGQIIRETDFTGRTLAYQYDKLGRRTQVQYPDGQQLRWHYSVAGLLVKQESWQPEEGTWVLKATTTYEYNPRHQLVKATNADAVVEYEYDKTTGLPTCERINGREIRREWDNLTGRPLSESLDGHTLHFGYHPLSGALNHFQFNQHAPLTLRHDALGRETVRESAHGFILASRYTATSLLAHQSAGRNSPFFQEALAENDPHFPPQATAVNRSWQYDRAHNVRVIDDSRWGQTRYRYNTNDQILHTLFDSSRPHEEQFSYDANGNLSQHLPVDAQGAMAQFTQRQQAGRVVQRGDTHYHYDDNGRLVEKIEQCDGFRPQIWRYRWDTQNQLTHCETPDGSRWQYQYDPFGRRIRKIKARDGKLTAANLQLWLAGRPDLPENPKALGGYDYLWSGDQLIEEVPYQADGTRLEARRVRWLYEPGSLTPAARFERGKLHYAISDHQGTVRELLDEQGEMVWGQHLTTWGHAQNRGGVPSHHPDHHVQCNFRFLGQYEDEESGLCYNRHRYYSPETAQYISSDPIGLMGGFNPYSYVHNPSKWVDPYGLAGGKGNKGEPVKPKTPEVVELDPKTIRFSQTSVNDTAEITQSMKAKGWDGDPIDVIRMKDGGLTTIDNTRVLAASRAGINVKARVHDGSTPIPQEFIRRFTTAKGVPSTWEEAINLRIGKQNAGYRKRYPNGSTVIGSSD